MSNILYSLFIEAKFGRLKIESEKKKIRFQSLNNSEKFDCSLN